MGELISRYSRIVASIPKRKENKEMGNFFFKNNVLHVKNQVLCVVYHLSYVLNTNNHSHQRSPHYAQYANIRNSSLTKSRQSTRNRVSKPGQTDWSQTLRLLD